MNPRCPTCSSLDVERADTLTCRACGTTWRLDGDRPVQVQRRSSRATPIAVAAVGCLLAVVGYRALTPPTAAPEALPPAPQQEAAQGMARAEITDVREGTNAAGARFWLMTYHNAGGAPIDRPGVVVRISDATGKVLREEGGDGPRDVLPPGESMPAFVLMADPPSGLPPDARVQVEAVPPQAAVRDAWKIPLKVEGVVTKPQALGGTLVVGRIINPHRGRARFVEVRVVGVDAAGHPVSWAQGLPDIEDLDPGVEAPFQVRAGSFEIEAPARYEAYALGNVR